jgi:hypothetical protein
MLGFFTGLVDSDEEPGTALRKAQKHESVSGKQRGIPVMA